MIWGADYWDHVRSFNTIGCSRMVRSKSKPTTFEGMGQFMNAGMLMMMRFKGLIKKAGTIEGLAKKLNLPVEEFKNILHYPAPGSHAGLSVKDTC